VTDTAGLHFEDVSFGDELPSLVRGPMTTTHVMRWSAAIENWHRIHYDQPFAVEHDKLPALLLNGSWKQHVLVQLVRGWAEPTGWLAHIKMSFRGMDFVGDTITAWGRVTEVEERDGLGIVVCEIGLRNQRGEETTPGTATVALPLRGGREVPYPFPGLGG
jgi:acyl dehydratase